jgi:hypothetical protein
MEITEFTRFEGVVDKFQVVSMGWEFVPVVSKLSIGISAPWGYLSIRVETWPNCTFNPKKPCHPARVSLDTKCDPKD